MKQIVYMGIITPWMRSFWCMAGDSAVAYMLETEPTAIVRAGERLNSLARWLSAARSLSTTSHAAPSRHLWLPQGISYLLFPRHCLHTFIVFSHLHSHSELIMPAHRNSRKVKNTTRIRTFTLDDGDESNEVIRSLAFRRTATGRVTVRKHDLTDVDLASLESPRSSEMPLPCEAINSELDLTPDNGDEIDEHVLDDKSAHVRAEVNVSLDVYLIILSLRTDLSKTGFHLENSIWMKFYVMTGRGMTSNLYVMAAEPTNVQIIHVENVHTNCGTVGHA